MKGSLTHEDYLKLYNEDQLYSQTFDIKQIQPSSFDLSLSNECYEIKYSFLSPNIKVREKLDNLIVKKISFIRRLKKNSKTLIVGVTYKVKNVEIIIPPSIVAPTASLEPSPAPGPILPITSGNIAIIVLNDVIIIGLNLKLQASFTAFSISLPLVLN